MLRRNTMQKAVILDAVKTLANHPSAQEVYEHINANYPNIGKSTVYRNLDLLASEGKLKKITASETVTRFDHTLTRHYHVNCICCHNVYDVMVKEDINLSKDIVNNDGIKFLDYDIVFKGICLRCQENNKIANNTKGGN